MKRGTPDHPKILTLADALYKHLLEQGLPLSAELCQSLACGMFERLCHFTARYAPAGDIGKYSDIRIALAMGWTLDASWLIDILTTVTKQLDLSVNGARLYVHDWHDHSDDAADKWLHDNNLTYANGAPTRRGKKSRLTTDEVATESRPSGSGPTSGSEPESFNNRTGDRTDQTSLTRSERPNGSKASDRGEDRQARGPDLDLTGIDWGDVAALADAVGKMVPLRTAPKERENDRRQWIKYAVLVAKTTFPQSWLMDAADKAARSPQPKKSKRAIFVSQLADTSGMEPDHFHGMVRQINLPRNIWKSGILGGPR